MRNPIPVLAAVLLAAVGALAADLPTWKTTDDGPWREIDFTDAAGTYHTLYCPWAACGTNRVKTGQAKLYVLERTGSVPYTTHVPYQPQYASTYAGKFWEWLKKGDPVPVQSAKTSYKSQLSHFVLDIAANKAVIPGTDVAIAVLPPHDSVDNVNPIWRVEQPSALADDAPKPVQTKPEPKPGHTPLPKPRPNQKPKPQPQHKPKPGTTTPAAKATELSVLEYYWMIRPERSEYDAAIDPAKKPTAAALQTAYQKAREKVAANLRDELQAPYKALLAKGDFAGIDGLLKGRNYSGFEVELRPAEYEALKKVLKTADAHTDFAKPNAAEQYDLEHRMVLASDGKVNLNEHVMAHRVTEKFRAMLPKAPGQQVDPAAPLTDADWAKITVPADRDAMKKQYDADFAKADTPEKKAGVNKDYRAKIDKWVADHKPAPPPASTISYDPAKLTPDMLKALPDAGRSFCSGDSNAGAAGNCSDVLADQNGASLKCAQLRGDTNKKTSELQSACMDRIKKCQAAGGNAGAPRPTLASYSKEVQSYCSNLLAGAQPPATNTTGDAAHAPPTPDCAGKKGKKDAPASTDAKKDPTTTAGSDVDPCPGGDDGKKSDPHFYDNLGNGIAFGIGGMLLGSFFGGPLMILAVGLAAGVGGYYFAKANDEPKKKKK